MTSVKLREVQIALRRLGYYSGAVDGFQGDMTGLAISRFQLDHEHPVRPVVDRWLLVNLGIIRPLVD
jgi:peptidoglycan hydrolase-like protein with peptidoglycan-binding domain